MKLFAFVALISLPLAAQLKVDLSQFPTGPSVEAVYAYDGSNNLLSACYALTIDTTSRRSSIITSISAATNANPVVFTSTGHGFNLNIRPKVTISGGTGNWTAVNGTFTATIVDANSFSIPIDSTTFGAVTGTLTYTTTAPRSNVAEWEVILYSYTSTNLILKSFLGGTASFSNKCSDAASTTLNKQ